jgi:CheY-like chemotaxis protein
MSNALWRNRVNLKALKYALLRALVAAAATPSRSSLGRRVSITVVNVKAESLSSDGRSRAYIVEDAEGTLIAKSYPPAPETGTSSLASSQSEVGSETRPEEVVLVVDDEPMIAMLLGRLAQGCGALTEVACNGREALEMMRARKPALVLLDLMMPVMNGEELLAIMETDPELQNVPVVIISTKPAVGPGVEREVPYLRKPFEPADVQRLIREALGGDGHAA